MLRVCAMISLAFALGGDAAMARSGVSCGAPTAVDPSAPLGRAVPVGDLLWLSLYPYSRGYPTKAIVTARRPLPDPVVLRGWNCATGRPLRFWYREGMPFKVVPVRPRTLRRRGDLSATFGPWPAQAMRGGYLMFWRTGRWKIDAYAMGRRVGSAVVRAASQ